MDRQTDDATDDNPPSASRPRGNKSYSICTQNKKYATILTNGDVREHIFNTAYLSLYKTFNKAEQIV